MNSRVGFMQGRLSPLVGGKIQAYPAGCWAEELPRAAALGFQAMEWTVDQAGLYDNALMTASGRKRIGELCQRHFIAIPSLTADCCMQAPFWKGDAANREARLTDLVALMAACQAAGIGIVVIPLVDNGRLESSAHEDAFVDGLARIHDDRFSVKMAIETDLPPDRITRLLARFPAGALGVNYDIGNSAALGYDPSVEIGDYGASIVNVHVKDRPLDGGTVPLGSGDADFDMVFACLARIGYGGNFILQTARAVDDDHAGTLAKYAAMTEAWIRDHFN